MTDHATLLASATASFPAPPEHGIRINEPRDNPNLLLLLRFCRYLKLFETSILGENKLDHRGLVVDDTTYIPINNGTAYVATADPGSDPALPANANSAAAILTHQ